ncbi:MAG: penicillin-binding protein 2 [Thermodesulfobacteriota bacterium]
MKKNRSLPSMQRTITRINKLDAVELFILKRRLAVATIFILALTSIIILRLWFLQVYKGYEFEEKAKVNRVRELRIVAPRGNILDRQGRLLITNRPSFNVVWTREDAPDPDQVIKRLAKILNEDISSILDRIRAGEGTPKYVPLLLKEDISWRALAYIENNHLNLPGVRIEVVPAREYLFGNLSSHLVGYLGEINKNELQRSRQGEYEGGDRVGKQGLEKLFEKQLRGEMGMSMLEVNARGFEKKQLAQKQPLPGNDIKLTIDADLQITAEKALEGLAGAVIATEVNTGRILVLASSPPLQLNEFVGGISQKAWQAMLGDPLHPLLNKSIQGQYPPASTYKMVTALAGLGEGIITPDTAFNCSGSIRLGKRNFRCWKKTGHGTVNLKRALAESCDVYFYLLSQDLHVDTIASYAKSLGLGQKTSINLEHEKGGLIPTADWKLKKYQERWQPGENLTIAIGQGFNLATPLQINVMTGAIANGGITYRPQFIEEIIDPDSKTIQMFEPIRNGEFKGSEENLELIRQGLIAAVNGPNGTGEQARLEEIIVAGKTGTAQVVHLSHVEDIDSEEKIPYKMRDHAWFTCYAPADKPEIAVTVLVEHGRHGGSTAAPIAHQILTKYFKPIED